MTLPYVVGTSAQFSPAGFNGRRFDEDVMDVMLTLACNLPIADGVTPDQARIRKEFPYYGAPYSTDEQAGVTPAPRPTRK